VLRQEELTKITGKFTVPQVFVKGQFIGGYDAVQSLRLAGGLNDIMSHVEHVPSLTHAPPSSKL
jgi:glutaredoxin-related protein